MGIKQVIKKITPKPIWEMLRRVKSFFEKRTSFYMDGKLTDLSNFLESGEFISARKTILECFPRAKYLLFQKRIINKMIYCIDLNYKKHDKEKYFAEAKIFQTYISKADMRIFSFDEWHKLKQISICCGLFLVANICRNKANSLVLSVNKNNVNWKLKQFLVNIEYGDLDKAKKILDGLQERERYGVFHNYLQILEKKKFIRDDFSEKNDKKFFDYINGKDVAILGPAYDGDCDISADCYIRNNFKGIDSIPERQRNLPTHITYYNASNGIKISKTPNATFLSDLDFIIIKDMGHYVDKSIFDTKIQNKIRGTPTIYDMFIFSSPYMLPIMLFDLVCFNTNSIMVYGNNLYNSYILYSREYIENGTENFVENVVNDATNYQKRIFSFAIHGIIDNFLFLQTLYKKGLFETDEYFANMLSRSVEEYLQQMEYRWVYPYI